MTLKKQNRRAKSNKLLLILLLVFFYSSELCFAEINFLQGTAYKTGIQRKQLSLGASEIINSNQGIKRIAITDPEILDLRVLSKTSAILRGKTLGRTSLLIWENGPEENRPTRFDVIVKRDVSNLLARLKLLDPNIQLEYIVIPTASIGGSSSSTTGPYATSYKAQITNVGEPPPSVVINNPEQSAQGSGGNSTNAEERFVLTGNVKNGEVIAKAIMMTSTYLGENGDPKVVVRDGGMLAKELSSVLSSGSASSGGGGSGSAFEEEGSGFSSNLKANLENGSVVTSASGKVISFLKVKTRSQIAIKVRFYEIKKTKGKAFKAQFGSRLPGEGVFATGGANGSPVAGQELKYEPAGDGARFPEIGYKALSLASTGAFPSGSIFGLLPKANLFFSLEAIESKGEGRVLAEPTIVVSNGEVGSFRAGGEVPIPSSTSSGLGVVAQEFEYKPFGISLNILPTITDEDTILMNIKAQTVDIDNNSTRGVVNAPSFNTRKISTQVELDPTQALVLAGLIDQTSSRALSKVPLIGDIPILGTLARSKEFSRGETELIIVLSPEIIRAANSDQLSAKVNSNFQKYEGEDYSLVPLRIPKLNRSRNPDIPVRPGAFSHPTTHPVDRSRPSLLNDLDQIYE